MTSMSPPIGASPNTMQFDARIFSRVTNDSKFSRAYQRSYLARAFPRLQATASRLSAVNGCCTISGYSDLRCENYLHHLSHFFVLNT